MDGVLDRDSLVLVVALLGGLLDLAEDGWRLDGGALHGVGVLVVVLLQAGQVAHVGAGGGGGGGHEGKDDLVREK